MNPARDHSLEQLEIEVATMMSRVRRAVVERARGVHPDLQAGGYAALTYIDKDGPVRASELIAALGVDKAAMSRQVQQLLELGLVEGKADPDDKRATLLTVTMAGRDRLAAVGRERRAGLDRRLAGWDDDELARFVSDLSRYNTTLDA